MNKKKKRFTVYGNCQAYAISQQLLKYPEFSDLYDYVHIDPCFSIGAKEVESWVRKHAGSLDLLIAQNLRAGWRDENHLWDVGFIKAALKPSGELLRYTDVYFRGGNPLLVYPITFPRFGHCDYTDLVSLVMVSLGFTDAQACVDVFRDSTLLTASEIQAIHSLGVLELSSREAGLEIKFSEALAELAKSSPGFYTFNHPSSQVLDLLVKEVFLRIGIPVNDYVNGKSDPLSTVKFPMPECIRMFYCDSGIDTAQFQDYDCSMVTIESRAELELYGYFEESLAALKSLGSEKILSEIDQHRRNGISAISLSGVERAVANRLSVSVGTLKEVGKLNLKGISPDFILTKANPQAIGFMSDIASFIRDALLPRHSGEHFSVLDLGAKTAAGSELLAGMGQSNSYSKLKFSVTCADIDSTFLEYSHITNRHVEYVASDVFELGRTWDIVLCSHVIEHVPEPMEFIHKLRAIANKYVILAFPFIEDPNQLIPGHINSIGHDFIRTLKPIRYVIYDGLFWSQSFCCIALIDADK